VVFKNKNIFCYHRYVLICCSPVALDGVAGGDRATEFDLRIKLSLIRLISAWSHSLIYLIKPNFLVKTLSTGHFLIGLLYFATDHNPLHAAFALHLDSIAVSAVSRL